MGDALILGASPILVPEGPVAMLNFVEVQIRPITAVQVSHENVEEIVEYLRNEKGYYTDTSTLPLGTWLIFGPEPGAVEHLSETHFNELFVVVQPNSE